MKNILAIVRKEIIGYLSGGTGYVFSGLLILVSSWLFISDLFLLQQADIRPYFGILAFLLSIFVPAISMGLIADERKNGNWEVIKSLPVTELEVVLGKFIGSGIYLLFSLGLSLPVWLTLIWLGRPDMGMMMGGAIGVLVLGWCYLSAGIFFSSLSSQPLVGFLTSSVFLLLNNLIGQETLLSKVPSEWAEVVGRLSLSYRIGQFGNGLLPVSDVFFCLSWMAIFLTLTILWLRQTKK